MTGEREAVDYLLKAVATAGWAPVSYMPPVYNTEERWSYLQSVLGTPMVRMLLVRGGGGGGGGTSR